MRFGAGGLPFTFGVLLSALLLAGCDRMRGVERTFRVDSLPDFQRLAHHIEAYSDVDKVEYRRGNGGAPLTLNGIERPDEVHYITYEGGENVRGTLSFIRNYTGRIDYRQSLLLIKKCPPREWIEATLPVMERIERDLRQEFGFSELPEEFQVNYVFMDPLPGKKTEPAPP